MKRSVELINLTLLDWYPVQANEYEVQTSYYVQLVDEIRPKIIKKVFDLDAAIVEIHTHIGTSEAHFSPSDLEGFKEFVPHIMWRLDGKPYAAIVVTVKDFDALIWIDNPNEEAGLTELRVADKILTPNGITMRRRMTDEFRSI